MKQLEKEVLLVGAGEMGREYAKILIALKKSFVTVALDDELSDLFEKEFNLTVYRKGITSWLNETESRPKYVINATTGNVIGEISRILIDAGFKYILIEKPGAKNLEDLNDLYEKAKERNAKVLLGYNRRFYSSSIEAKKIIEEDGGVKSFLFEFTEWSHVVIKAGKPKQVLKNWLFQNSTHVIDLAFYLGGEPRELKSFVSGSLPWHPSGSVYTGAGITNEEALFSYHANWKAPGRWSVEMLTNSHRLIFKPIEKLKIQKIGSVKVEELDLDYSLDQKFKPGLYRQVKAYLNRNTSNFIDINKHKVRANVYSKIINGDKLQ